MIHAWSFVIISYGLAFFCLTTLSLRAICRYRRAAQRMASHHRTPFSS